MWPNGLSAGLRTKVLSAQGPVRAHAWVAGQVSRGERERQPHIAVSLSLSPSPLLSLKINKIIKKEIYYQHHSAPEPTPTSPCPSPSPHWASSVLPRSNNSPESLVIISWLTNFNSYLRICLLILRDRGRKVGREKREREKGRNISVREKHQSVVLPMCPDQGPNPQPRYVP